MGLLDDLKRKAEAVKEAQSELPRVDEARANAVRAVALPALFRIHRCLDELVAQLKILQQEDPATLRIFGIGEVTGFIQSGYDVFATGMPPDNVTLRANLRHQKRVPLELKAIGSINAWIETVRQHGLQAKCLRMIDSTSANQRAYIAIENSIPVTLQFKIDYEAGALQLYSRNFDELSERRQIFNPASVTERWCEELIKFVLRQEHRFMVQEVAPDIREQLQRRLAWEKQKEQALEEGPMARSNPARLKGLFRRSPHLKLRYQDRGCDLSMHIGPFTFGRLSDCDLTVRESHVSRFHARIEWKDDHFLLTDESTNGTTVRYADGRIERLRKTATALIGSGIFALGTEPVETNPYAIFFET
jgi:FHA domain